MILSILALILLRVILIDSLCKFSRFLKEILNGAKCILLPLATPDASYFIEEMKNSDVNKQSCIWMQQFLRSSIYERANIK